MKNQNLGALSLFTAAGFYGTYGILSRLIGSSFGNFSQNWARNLGVLIIILVVIYIRGSKILIPRKQDLKWIVLWFMSGSWVTVLTFIGFNNLQIGTTYLVLYSSMILSGFLSGKVFFREKLNTLKYLSLALSLAGLFIIYKFSISPREVIFVILVLISGFATGIWNTISKKFSNNYSNNQMVMMDAGSSVVAAFLGSIIFKESIPLQVPPIKWFWVAIYAVIQTINVGLIVYGFKNLEAQIGSIILPVEIVFATIFSYLIFREHPQVSTFIGGIFIISAAILPNIQFVKSRRG